MKNFLLLALLVLNVNLCCGQNSFPSEGNVGIGINPGTELLDIRGNNSKIKFRSTSGNINSVNIIDLSVPYNANAFKRGSWIYFGRGEGSHGYRVGGQSSNTWANGITMNMEYFSGSWKKGISLNYLGNVGIGTSTPDARLDVMGDIFLRNQLKISGRSNPNLLVSNTYSGGDVEAVIKAAYSYNEAAKNRSARIELGTHHSKEDGNYYRKVWSVESVSTSIWANVPEFRISQGDLKRFCIDYRGNVGIGKGADPSMKLDVAGTIRANEIKVVAQTADFVFEDNYSLRDLNQVEKFIKQHKHLPDIPSAAEMEASGVNLAEMNKLLLQKIEELTLYVIEKEKDLQELKIQNNTEVKKREYLEFKMEDVMSLLKETSKRLDKIENSKMQ
ncbi:hypothetical protein BY457_1215 [Marinilabilia salmonicolor]|jgi:hypothetical protein|uniref:hypothetical protein n=1 Tax=Marinilabilia salmonicolor TaxID=989 RepID=UPI000D074A32|nr:hypothetical protein [Marinilabilia salmonicolor]PRY93815.1 hypothetical protein BY457_1215 [Marinilabilia salmonicolor]